MHIKSIVIDGFKSYAQRVEIGPFDTRFNAITGFNGSGKSNILDSICFVLGITNLSRIRANTLQDLIYKNGQAGVTKATVTIIFDNRDKKRSPINFEKHDEITITRQISCGAAKNRYLLNGTTVANKNITDFFNSVQMNVNNPHFLIMQGRITQVLNMKPLEIMSMIEEAAGTRGYEIKRLGAQRTMEKKELKLREIDTRLNDEIIPKIEELKKERAQYLELQKAEREYELLNRIHVTFLYVKNEKAKNTFQTQYDNCVQNIAKMNAESEGHQEQIKEYQRQIKEMQKSRDSESSRKLEKIEKQVNELEKEEAQKAAAHRNMMGNIKSEENRIKDMETSLAQDISLMRNKEKEIANEKQTYEKLKAETDEIKKNIDLCQKKYQAKSSGLEVEGECNLQQQLMNAEREQKDAETERLQCGMQIEHYKKQLQVKQNKLNSMAGSSETDRDDIVAGEKLVAQYRAELGKIDYQEGSLEEVIGEQRKTLAESRALDRQLENLKYECRSPINFEYEDPEPGFDRNLVRGRVCRLFRCKDRRFYEAIEAIASSKLFNVIVENEATSKKLIQSGKLQHRTTFLPLNQMRGQLIPENVLRNAKNMVGEGQVFFAMDVVQYERSLEPAMRYLFGNCLICSDGSTANSLMSKCRVKCVTLDGDVYDPSGSAHGGAPDSRPSTLDMVDRLADLEKQKSDFTQRIDNLNRLVDAKRKAAQKYTDITQKLENKVQELELKKERLKQSEYNRCKEEVEDCKTKLNEFKTRTEECKKQEAVASKKVAALLAEIDNAKESKEDVLKSIEAELARWKKKLEDVSGCWQRKQQEHEILKNEIEDLKKSIEKSGDDIKQVAAALEKLREEANSKEESLSKLRQELEKARKEKSDFQEELNRQNSEITAIVRKQDKLNKEVDANKLKILKEEGKLKRFEKDKEDTEGMLRNLMKKYKWLETEVKKIGQPNGINLADYDEKDVASKIPKLEETISTLSRTVAKRSVDLLGQQEEEFKRLIAKKKTVEEDKLRIIKVIKKFEEKKIVALHRAWEQVNRDFGEIFSHLLPDANSKLDTVAGKSMMEGGLEIKVSFGKVWLEGLTALSGGQRSLVALSFILAMLLFKPAPIYILDEVDAALDASHTQNIGSMLRHHFSNAQFIVVSLKEGMFDNANVLFRTKFVDGRSTVKRTLGKDDKE